MFFREVSLHLQRHGAGRFNGECFPGSRVDDGLQIHAVSGHDQEPESLPVYLVGPGCLWTGHAQVQKVPGLLEGRDLSLGAGLQVEGNLHEQRTVRVRLLEIRTRIK